MLIPMIFFIIEKMGKYQPKLLNFNFEFKIIVDNFKKFKILVQLVFMQSTDKIKENPLPFDLVTTEATIYDLLKKNGTIDLYS